MSKVNYMIDIETLGGPPNGAIVAIGACQFDPHQIQTGWELKQDGFYTTVSARSSQNYGMKIDADTVLWWFNQGESARKEVMKGDQTLKDALLDLSDYLTKFNKDPVIWCNGASFDATILDWAYGACRLKTPWPFRNIRCLRTFRSLVPKEEIQRAVDNVKASYPIVEHHALDDCIEQSVVTQMLIAKLHAKP